MPKQIDQEKLRNLMEVYKNHLEKELGAKLEYQPKKQQQENIRNLRKNSSQRTWAFMKSCVISAKKL